MTTSSRLVVLVLGSLALAGPVSGQVPVFLPEFPVNTTTAFVGGSGVLLKEDGTFIVVWDESADVLGRRFDAQTSPVGDPVPLTVTATGYQGGSDVAQDASGRFVVVWMEDYAVQGRRFDADGTPLGGNFQVSTSTPAGDSYFSSPRVASNASGNFVVSWRLDVEKGDTEVLARVFDHSGAPRGDDFPVNQFTTGFQVIGGIAMSPSGFVVTWGGAGTGSSNGIFARLFDSFGNPVTNDFTVHTAPLVSTFPRRPDTAMNAAGDFVVVWDDGDYDSYALNGRRWSAAGTPASGVFPISGAPGVFNSGARVASDSSGNFLVVWNQVLGDTLGGSDANAIRGRFFGAEGVGETEFPVNQITAGQQFYPGVSLRDDGSFVVSFSSALDYQNAFKARKSGLRASPQIAIDPNAGVSSPAGGSLGNGVFEPGETVVPQTAWVNDTAAGAAVSGTAVGFTGPPGATYTVHDSAASYGTIPAGQTATCIDGLDCYSISVSAPAVRPVPHWDARLQESLSIGVPKTWIVHIGESFTDVPTSNLFYAFIETLLHSGVTGGCAGGGYCPTSPVTRAQMAVFLLKAKFGGAHVPPPCTGTVFDDVPCTGGPFDPWIEELKALDVTGGCSDFDYCPNNTVTRQQMAVFLLKALEGSAYDPPDCSGVFNDVPCTPGTGFSDWIEELYDRQITGGCTASPLNYCPTNPNNRGQMAVFLTKTFGLVLY